MSDIFQAVEGTDCLHVVFVQHLNTHQALVLTVISNGGSNVGNNNTDDDDDDDDASESLKTVTFSYGPEKTHASFRAEKLFMFILISGGRRAFMLRDQVHGEKRKLWNGFSIVSNKIMIRKKRRGRGNCG